VLDAILAVGGLSQFASGNRARIVRIDHGQETTIHVKLANLVNNGDVRENLPLRPGDVLVVPQSIF
jgi:polysaccharide biosynthesis/export protein